MNGGSIVFSVDGCRLTENYGVVVAELRKVIDETFETFLMLSNEVCESGSGEYDLNTLNSKIMKIIPNAELFNPTKNLIYL